MGPQTNPAALLFLGLVLMVSVLVYFAPTIVAARRNCNVLVVLVANTLFGWTLVEWFGALIVALLPKDRQ